MKIEEGCFAELKKISSEGKMLYCPKIHLAQWVKQMQVKIKKTTNI